MVAGGDEHRGAARRLEDVHREGEGLRVHAFAVEQVSGDQDPLDAAMDRLGHGVLERPLLLAAPFRPAFGSKPAERGAEMEV